MRKLLLGLLVLAALPAFGKSLHWDDMRVAARLDADGRLIVRETLTFVFDGDWNGGERTFRATGRQTLEVERIVRIENGQEIALTAGDLDQVDHYQVNGTVARWRSRLASDPPFENKSITYAIDYRMAQVLTSLGDNRFRLSHDFSFGEREGAIRNFSLALALDPSWTGAPSPYRLTRTNVLPGEGVPVGFELTRSAAATPLTAVWMGPTATFRNTLLALFLGTLALFGFLFYRAELPTGRFAPLEPVESITLPWLEQNLFPHDPEVIGAAWDDTIGAPEVAAVLARLTAAGNLRSHIDGKVLHLELLVDRDELRGYDRHLVEMMFFSGDRTDTEKIRSHYESNGFDPSKVISDGITEKLSALPEWTTKIKRTSLGLDLLLLALAAGLLIYAGLSSDQNDNGLLARAGVFSVLFGVFAIVAAILGSGTVTRYWRPALWIGLSMFPILWNAVSALRSNDHGHWALVAVTFSALAVTNFVLHLLRTSQSPMRIAFRKRLASGQRYFRSQLASAEPALDDKWLPYILAFGLGRNVDRWFRVHGKSSDSGGFTSSSSTSSTSSTSSSTSWSGGGGGFGGAGATGAWAVAAGAMAAGVPTPSSSSDSGGGSSSSDSGGGGGGGW